MCVSVHVHRLGASVDDTVSTGVEDKGKQVGTVRRVAGANMARGAESFLAIREEIEPLEEFSEDLSDGCLASAGVAVKDAV